MKNIDLVRNKKRMTINGYYAYWLPGHHLAGKNATVYEHMLVAEDMISRRLQKGEVVHHIDHNRKNNSYENLMVFKSEADHAAYHMGNKAIKDGDVYIASRMTSNICPICGNIKSESAAMCMDCSLEYRAKNIPPKEKLYMLLKNKNMCEIGRIYDVSDNAVRKWCKKYNLPFKRKDIIEFREIEFGIVKQTREKKPATPPKPVRMISLHDNNVKEFTSTQNAARYIMDNNIGKGGLNGIACHIGNVCKGLRQTAYGCLWEYI